MSGGRHGLGRGLILLGMMGCSHGSSTGRPVSMEPLEAENTGTRTKGGDSASFRIPVLIASGELQEAEALLAQSVASGLVSRELATHLRERIAERKGQRSSDSDRRPPLGHSEDVMIEEPKQRTCWTCRELPGEYSFHSAQQALEAIKQRLGAKNLVLHSPSSARSGPCPEIGEHYNVRVNGERAGSIVCCPCCVESTGGPLEWKKCRVVW
jgi:hypothetical protein